MEREVHMPIPPVIVCSNCGESWMWSGNQKCPKCHRFLSDWETASQVETPRKTEPAPPTLHTEVF